MVWRVVGEKMATLKEIETHYDLVDLLDANATLDLIHEAERRSYEETATTLNEGTG